MNGRPGVEVEGGGVDVVVVTGVRRDGLPEGDPHDREGKAQVAAVIVQAVGVVLRSLAVWAAILVVAGSTPVASPPVWSAILVVAGSTPVASLPLRPSSLPLARSPLALFGPMVGEATFAAEWKSADVLVTASRPPLAGPGSRELEADTLFLVFVVSVVGRLTFTLLFVSFQDIGFVVEQDGPDVVDVRCLSSIHQ